MMSVASLRMTSVDPGESLFLLLLFADRCDVPVSSQPILLFIVLFIRIQAPAASVAGLRSGCFCPEGQMLAEEHKQICVSQCTSE